jgi:hypothetical protein
MSTKSAKQESAAEHPPANEAADIAQRTPPQAEHAASEQQPPAGVQTVEAEDPHLTGGSKSHQRRVLKLNVEGSAGEGSDGQSQRHPDTPAGQHATGSFTGTDDTPTKDTHSRK